jgi:acetyl-CoA carboxylase carboxyltransferase component
MVWQPEIEEIERRRQMAFEMGGEDRIARQHSDGKLTIRERIDGLLDSGTFFEIGELAGYGEYDEDRKLVGFTPLPYVTGIGKVDGRLVAIGGEDFTIRGGTAAGAPRRRGKGGKWADSFALEYEVPLIYFADGAGASVRSVEHEQGGHLPSSDDFTSEVDLLGKVPVIAAVVGSVAGRPAGRAMMAHWTIMVKGSSQIFPGGPPVVRRAISEEIDKEALGGSHIHVYKTGVIHNEAEDEDDCMQQIRDYLSYMPNNVWELPARVTSSDDPNRRDEELLSIIPRNSRRAYDMRKLISMVVDDGKMFEIRPHWGTTAITALARVNGYVIGVMANDPRELAGAIDADGANKQTHFMDVCDTFNIPIVLFNDVPGFMVGSKAELQGTLRHGMRTLMANVQMTVPFVQFHVRKAYGLAAAATGSSASVYIRMGWPSGEWGSIPVEGGVEAAYRREIANHPNPDQRRAELEEEMNKYRSPLLVAESFGIEKMIDPRDTRRYLSMLVEAMQPKLKRNAGPKAKYGVRP